MTVRKEREIISFKLLCISVRCMGTGFMDIVVSERAERVMFLPNMLMYRGGDVTSMFFL